MIEFLYENFRIHTKGENSNLNKRLINDQEINIMKD
jgi:hypothetical protein